MYNSYGRRNTLTIYIIMNGVLVTSRQITVIEKFFYSSSASSPLYTVIAVALEELAINFISCSNCSEKK